MGPGGGPFAEPRPRLLALGTLAGLAALAALAGLAGLAERPRLREFA
ncbi:hypothetical protein [Streptomyces sp. NRRL S-350]|nr:hypothetical protein [Streptomyces sp. NRRL S-350]